MKTKDLRAYLETIGANVARLRRRHGWSQADLAQGVRMERSHIQKIEHGRAEMSLRAFLNFLEVFKARPGDLFRKVAPPTSRPGRPKRAP